MKRKKTVLLSIFAAVAVSAGAGAALSRSAIQGLAEDAAGETAKPAPTQEQGFLMREGASVWENDPSGIRFSTYVNADYYNALKSDEEVVSFRFGTLVVPASEYSGKAEELVHGENIQDIPMNESLARWEEDEVNGVSYLVYNTVQKYSESARDNGYYSAKMYARSYVYIDKTDDDTDNGTYVYALDENGDPAAQVRSIAQVAALALNNGAEDHDGTLKKIIDQSISTVKIDRLSTVIGVNEAVTLNAIVSVKGGYAPADGKDFPVKWVSSNEAVATVDNGVVKGVAAGMAKITATVGDKSYTAAVGVCNLPDNTIGAEAIAVYKDKWASIKVSREKFDEAFAEEKVQFVRFKVSGTNAQWHNVYLGTYDNTGNVKLQKDGFAELFLSRAQWQAAKDAGKSSLSVELWNTEEGTHCGAAEDFIAYAYDLREAYGLVKATTDDGWPNIVVSPTAFDNAFSDASVQLVKIGVKGNASGWHNIFAGTDQRNVRWNSGEVAEVLLTRAQWEQLKANNQNYSIAIWNCEAGTHCESSENFTAYIDYIEKTSALAAASFIAADDAWPNFKVSPDLFASAFADENVQLLKIGVRGYVRGWHNVYAQTDGKLVRMNPGEAAELLLARSQWEKLKENKQDFVIVIWNCEAGTHCESAENLTVYIDYIEKTDALAATYFTAENDAWPNLMLNNALNKIFADSAVTGVTFKVSSTAQVWHNVNLMGSDNVRLEKDGTVEFTISRETYEKALNDGTNIFVMIWNCEPGTHCERAEDFLAYAYDFVCEK